MMAAHGRWPRTIARSCYCAAEINRSVGVVVPNGVVESRRYVDTGAAVAPQFIQYFPSVDGLFALLEEAVAVRPASRRAT